MTRRALKWYVSIFANIIRHANVSLLSRFSVLWLWASTQSGWLLFLVHRATYFSIKSYEVRNWSVLDKNDRPKRGLSKIVWASWAGFVSEERPKTSTDGVR